MEYGRDLVRMVRGDLRRVRTLLIQFLAFQLEVRESHGPFPSTIG